MAAVSANPTASWLLRAAEALRDRAGAVDLQGAGLLRKGFGTLEYVYNPLAYAWDLHRAWIERFADGSRRHIVLVGMNPGPWGMGQTGIPFGDPAIVRDWMGLDGRVTAPHRCHPARPVRGLLSSRREESGTTLYGWARKRYGTAERFFSAVWIVNYCPLLMFDGAGRNVTPEDFKSGTRQLGALQEACDEHLGAVLEIFRPPFVVGIGKFAARRAALVIEARELHARVGCITHPSPQTRGHWGPEGWAGLAEAELRPLGAAELVGTPPGDVQPEIRYNS